MVIFPIIGARYVEKYGIFEPNRAGSYILKSFDHMTNQNGRLMLKVWLLRCGRFSRIKIPSGVDHEVFKVFVMHKRRESYGFNKRILTTDGWTFESSVDNGRVKIVAMFVNNGHFHLVYDMPGDQFDAGRVLCEYRVGRIPFGSIRQLKWFRDVAATPHNRRID